MADQPLTEPLIGNRPTDPASTQSTKRESVVVSFGKGLSESPSEKDKKELIACPSDSAWAEMKMNLSLAGPMICVSLLQNLLSFVSVLFVGHLGELELASAALANSFAAVTGISVLLGMACALEPLCGQAFGAKQYHMLGIYLQRAILVLSITSIPLAVVWYNIDAILRAVGQDAEISAMAGEFARWLIPSLFAYSALQPMVRFLQAQSVVVAMVLLSVATLCLHVPLCWLIIYKWGFGFRGAAFASSISNWLNVLLLAMYISFSPRCRKTWTSFSREAFHDLKAFVILAAPAAVMMTLEYGSFEVLVLVSGLLPNPRLETSTLSICLNMTALMYMIPFGMGAAVSTRVSNELGAGHPQAAKLSVRVAMALGILQGVLMAILLVSMRNVWGWAFTNEAEVANYVSRVIPFLATLTILNGIQATLIGVARGSGWLAFGALANLGAYYLVGLPLAIGLAFFGHLNGTGLWNGLLCGVTTQVAILLIATLCTNWDKQAKIVADSLYSSATATLPITLYCQKEDSATERICSRPSSPISDAATKQASVREC